MPNHDWLDDNEYPSEKDIDELGEDSPIDYDPLTMGYIGRGQTNKQFWTPKNIIIAVVVLLIISALFLPPLLQLLN